MELHLIRHGPKNNSPQAHETGVEALLDWRKIPAIRAYASDLFNSNSADLFCVETTPVERAMVTGTIIAEEFSAGAQISVEQKVNELIGSYGLNPTTGEAVNLSPRTMSKLWAEGKERQKEISTLPAEHLSLWAWCKQGFDNPQAHNPEDPGISLREIACRVGTYLFERLPRMSEREVVVAVGHSGDIEPFLYLCLEMLAGRDGTAAEVLTRHFESTGGALYPLQGIILREVGGNITLDYRGLQRKIGPEIFEQQAQWFRDYGKGEEVLKQKITGGK